MDFFNGPDVAVLEGCQHRRPIFNRSESQQAAFDAAVHATRKQVVGKNRVTANGYRRTYVEDLPKAA
jgi:hypothetical protein